MPGPRRILELGVEEAYGLLLEAGGGQELPPLEAIENEDWGRDYLLARLAGLGDEALARLNLEAGGDGDVS